MSLDRAEETHSRNGAVKLLKLKKTDSQPLVGAHEGHCRPMGAPLISKNNMNLNSNNNDSGNNNNNDNNITILIKKL